MRTHNPILSRESLWKADRLASRSAESNTLTANGAATKAAILLMLTFVGAAVSWSIGVGISPALSLGISLVSGLAGFVLVFVTFFKPTLAPVTAPVYGVLEGLFLGAIALTFESLYPGIASQAVVGTLCVFMVMMFLYRSRLIRVTERLRSVVVAATIGIALTYFLSFILSFFLPITLFSGGALSIGFTLFVIAVAAFNLLLDFDFIERSEVMGAPKYMEWVAALALIVTLVWLYLEMLRLLSYLRQE